VKKLLNKNNVISLIMNVLGINTIIYVRMGLIKIQILVTLSMNQILVLPSLN